MFSSTFVVSLGFIIYPYAAGQVTTTAVCTTDAWTTNEKGQSPCLVTSALQAACDGGNFNVPALLPGQVYFGPQLGFGNPCTCSTVTYSMAMACGACQGAGINKWSTWMTNCSSDEISIGFFPLAIPSAITIPSWAYENVTAHDLWDANEALTIANEHVPDSSDLPQPTGTRSSNTNSNSKSTNVAAIAGGAAGGVVLIILIVLAIFFWRRRSKKRSIKKASGIIQPWTPNEQEKFLQPNDNNNHDGLPQQNNRGDAAPSPSSAGSHPYFDVPNVQPTVPQAPQQYQPYDPANPSTFPTAPIITVGTMFPPTDQTTQEQQQQQQQQLLHAPIQSTWPGSSSVRSLPTSTMSHNVNVYASSSKSGPTDTGMIIPMHPTSYGRTPSARNEPIVFTNTANQGLVQVQHDPSLYAMPYPSQNRLHVSYGSQQRQPGGYTGAAEI